MLYTSTELLDIGTATHGLIVTGYMVEFAAELTPSQFGQQDNGPWDQREVGLESIEFSYGPSPKIAQFQMWDPNSVEAAYLTGPTRTQAMTVPSNGDRCRIWHYDQVKTQYQLVFKGSVKSIHEKLDEGGIRYTIQVYSEICRLNESYVDFTANFLNDPANPSPYFDGSGYLVQPKLFNVFDLISLVLQYPDAYNNPQYFTPSMINWNGLDTDPRCGLFKPSNISMDTTKGEAIQQILDAAGNYTFLYVPGGPSSAGSVNLLDPPSTDQIVIVELNLNCNNCGNKWNIPFPTTSLLASESETPQYASNFSIIADQTEWSSKQMANVCRMTSAPIRFYSGHWFIPDRTQDFDQDPAATVNMVVDPGDTLTAMNKRSYNLENTWYRSNEPAGVSNDNRTLRRTPVGMPLFPDWNIHEDYLPNIIRINDVIVRNNSGAGVTASVYPGLIEWDTLTLGDKLGMGCNLPGKTNNLHVWQAWHCPNDCPACNGTGLVKAVYKNAANEPAFDFWAVSSTGQRLLTGTNYVVNPNEVVQARVNNYIFNPTNFGNVDSSGVPIPPTGLTAFDPTSTNDPVVSITGGYPLPWKNLCPYCRGVGKQPMYKIRNIQKDLFVGRNNQAATDFNNPFEIPMDPDATATAPEEWEKTQSRIMFHQDAVIHVELALQRELPFYQYRQESWAQLQIDTEASNDGSNDGLDANVQTFPNPLQYTTVTGLLAARFNLPSPDGTDHTHILPPYTSLGSGSGAAGGSGSGSDPGLIDFSCIVPYTSLMNVEHQDNCEVDYLMGRVIFADPKFIPCKKPFLNYKYDTDNRFFMVDTDGTLMRNAAAEYIADEMHWQGFWRVPRVWMQCFFIKDHYYNTGQTDPSNEPIQTVTLPHTDADGNTYSYNFRSMIIDGKWACEVQRTDGNNQDPGRPMQIKESDDKLNIEVYEDDYWAMPIPQTLDAVSADLEAYKTQSGQLFARGKLLQYQNITPGEVLRTTDGVTDLDNSNCIFRPKVFTWRLRDNRTWLMQKAVRQLELHDSLSVSGSIELAGVSNDLSSGLGYVAYPNFGNAAVVALQYNYTNGFESTVELMRERARIGELPPKADQLLNNVVKDVVQLRRQQNTPAVKPKQRTWVKDNTVNTGNPQVPVFPS